MLSRFSGSSEPDRVFESGARRACVEVPAPPPAWPPASRPSFGRRTQRFQSTCRSTVKITIVNCYDDSNKGSSAILWGLLRRLERTGAVDNVSLVSMFEQDHPLFKSAFRHVKTGFPNVVTVGSPLSSTVQLPSGS